MSHAVTEAALLEALKSVVDPNTSKDFVSARAVKNLRIEDGDVAFSVELGYPGKSQHPALRKALVAAARTVPGVNNVSVEISTKIVSHAVQRGVQLLPRVKNVIAVASGKGGVGKSTTTVNLALALAAEGASVGILDADIYGPSQPTMMGLSGRPESEDGKTIEPMENYGVQVMSIGFLIEPDQAMIWRGPMATQALDQLLNQTNWRELDYLLIDMPPGTGDIALTLSQRVPLTGAIIVTTPPKGRRVDPAARAELQALLGAKPPRRDRLIEYLHAINDRFGQLGTPHLAALAEALKLSQAEVYEVASFYHHFDVVREDARARLAAPPR
jgi:ATP-binding protein involved in chromosome partitioning